MRSITFLLCSVAFLVSCGDREETTPDDSNGDTAAPGSFQDYLSRQTPSATPTPTPVITTTIPQVDDEDIDTPTAVATFEKITIKVSYRWLTQMIKHTGDDYLRGEPYVYTVDDEITTTTYTKRTQQQWDDFVSSADCEITKVTDTLFNCSFVKSESNCSTRRQSENWGADIVYLTLKTCTIPTIP